MMAEGRPRQRDPELPDWTEVDSELDTVEQYCQLFADLLNASKADDEAPASDPEVLKVTIICLILPTKYANEMPQSVQNYEVNSAKTTLTVI